MKNLVHKAREMKLQVENTLFLDVDDARRVYEVDPLRDRRWPTFLERHARASVFHSVGWLEALHRTYGYEPIVFTNSPPTSDLKEALLFCRIHSRLTGHRIVSLPFSDHCTPLCADEEELKGLLLEVQKSKIEEHIKYVELRPVGKCFNGGASKLGFQSSGNYILHQVDLEPTVQEIFSRLHKDCVQRRVRHAERVGVYDVCGRSEKLLKDFFRLMIRTRARHGLLPQPHAWFKNVIKYVGEAVDLRVAYVKNVPIAAIMMLQFKNTSYFKYGCSDERFKSFGAAPLLLWRAIVKAKSVGCKVFDLGRTNDDDQGLIVFKNRWTRHLEPLTYWVYPGDRIFDLNRVSKFGWTRRIFGLLPDQLLAMAGAAIYRHIG